MTISPQGLPRLYFLPRATIAHEIEGRNCPAGGMCAISANGVLMGREKGGGLVGGQRTQPDDNVATGCFRSCRMTSRGPRPKKNCVSRQSANSKYRKTLLILDGSTPSKRPGRRDWYEPLCTRFFR